MQERLCNTSTFSETNTAYCNDADNIQSATNLIKYDCKKASLYLRNILFQSKSAGILLYVERKLYVIKHCSHLDDRQSEPTDLYNVT